MEGRKTEISLLASILSTNFFLCQNLRGEGQFLMQSLDLQITFQMDVSKIFKVT